MKEPIMVELDRISEILKDFNKFMHLFSKDEGEKTLAELYQLAGQIKTLLKSQSIREVTVVGEQFTEGMYKRGQLVSIRPVNDEKTYLGIYMGDVATSMSLGVKDDKFTFKHAGHNPAIFVPDLGKVVHGFESWWGAIESEEDFKKITDNDIQNVWYVKALKRLQNATNTENGSVGNDKESTNG